MKVAGLSIVVPVFNEEVAIESTVRTLQNIIDVCNFDVEAILVDDGSTDGTQHKLARTERAHNKIRVIRHAVNQGYGAALKTGIKNSSYEYIAITDADETYPNDRLVEFYKTATENNLDMLVGARVGSDASIPLIRRPAKWVLNKLANYLSERDIPDLNSGMRIMRGSVVNRFLKILPQGFSFTTTITLAMLTNGHSVRYEPIKYFRRAGTSKIRPIYDTINFTQLIIRTTLLFRPLKVFIPLSTLMFLVGSILVLYRILVGQEFGVTATVIFTGAIQVLAVGMLADLIDRRLGE
jgi:glycosyltransferase involved in cell wall biosynthesis